MRSIHRFAASWLTACFVLTAPPAPAADALAPPHTAPLTETGDLSAEMVAGIHHWLDRKLAESVAGRGQYWNRHLRSPEGYEVSIAPNRERLRKIIGVVDARVPPAMEFIEDEESSQIPQDLGYRVRYVRWRALQGVTAEGWLLEQHREIPAGRVVVLGDADQLPEEVAGLVTGIPESAQLARQLAQQGFEVLVPMLINRSNDFSGTPDVAQTDMPHREWVYRQAFEMGRHIIGYEVQKVLAAVDWFRQRNHPQLAVGVAGYGEGGLIAFYAAACDTRIDACLVRGYFGPREKIAEEPIYRNVWGLLREFGDAEIATLILPRALVVEHDEFPRVEGPPKPREGQRKVAAPGRLTTPAFAAVETEFRRLGLSGGFLANRHFLFNTDNERQRRTGESAAQTQFVQLLHGQKPSPGHTAHKPLARATFHPYVRQQRQLKELENHVQQLVVHSDKVRDAFFLNKVDRQSADAFARDAAPFRQAFAEDLIGKLDDPVANINPRSRRSQDTDKYAGYEVMLDVWPDVFAWGVLLVPKDLQPGEKRPVVVCQHGLEGLPEDTITAEGKGFQAYRAFAAKLAERGFITFSPHNPYRGGEHYKSLQRKLNPLKASLGSVIVAQHTQILNWLGTLPFVDKDRIAFYGLSYGGWSASRIPAVLERYNLSICSACFNDWARKTAGLDHVFCYMYHAQYEMPEWNLGHTFNNAEMAYLMIPRPFMVERGHHDGVSVDSWVASEYAKVRWLYTQLGLADRTTIEYFNGGHWIHGQGTYEFLHKHLEWPKRERE